MKIRLGWELGVGAEGHCKQIGVTMRLSFMQCKVSFWLKVDGLLCLFYVLCVASSSPSFRPVRADGKMKSKD